MSKKSEKIYIAVDDPVIAEQIRENLDYYAFTHTDITGPDGLGRDKVAQGYIPVITDRDGEENNGWPSSCRLLHLTTPLRMGALIEDIRKTLSMPVLADKIALGPYTLLTHQFILKSKAGNDIKLTEKERDILLYLRGAKGRIVGRDELLEHVWGYGEGLETHTLETHIYRLRQKIEKDPGAPAFLVTQDEGYSLKL